MVSMTRRWTREIGPWWITRPASTRTAAWRPRRQPSCAGCDPRSKRIKRRCARDRGELEDLLAAAPAATWPEAVEKARYLLGLFAQSSAAADPRRRKLIDRVMADFDHLLDTSTTD